jgi:hypothetical protein
VCHSLTTKTSKNLTGISQIRKEGIGTLEVHFFLIENVQKKKRIV